MSGQYILDERGEPVPCKDVLTWGMWFETAERVIQRDTVAEGVDVSTVFLGLDHRYGEGPPLLYETMIFGGPHDQWQRRYSTRAEAIAGHAWAMLFARGEIEEADSYGVSDRG